MRKMIGNMRISGKLTMAFTIIVVITLIVGIIGMLNIFSIKNADEKLYRECTQGLEYAGNATVTFQQLRYDNLKMDKTMSTNGSQDDVNKLVDSAKGELASISDSFEKCDRVLVTKAFRDMLESIKADWANYTALITQNLDYASKYDVKSFAANAKAAGDLGISIRDKSLALFSDLSQQASESSKANTVLANTAFIVMAVAIVVGIIICIILCRMLTGDMSYPVKKLAIIAGKVSEGNIQVDQYLEKKDYDVKNRKDEIGALALAFNKLIAYINGHVKTVQYIADGDLTVKADVRSEDDVLGIGLENLIDNLNNLVTTITSAAEQVESGAGLVSGSSVSLSQGATEQASTVQELTASLSEVASQTSLNAENAGKASSLANNARVHAENGNTLMKDMQKAMDDINESSNKISKIIKVIDDIAFQTNILALNAAVEAARAGQHGKGFAVVAEEVRTLAARSASAASETTEMIENSIRKVEAGTSIANETAEALTKIVDQVRDAAALVNSIAEASKGQAMGIEQISQGIAQVSQVTQTNVATSEESAAASEELASQSSHLRETISAFKVGDTMKVHISSGQKKSGGAPKLPGTVKALPASPAGSAAEIKLKDGDFGKY
jgi:methyl-accepting chemotaxis protein